MVMYWNKTYMNMKKICLFIMVLLGLASCSDQLTVSEKENVVQPATQVDDEYHYYLEKARWGEAGAYVKLADFYREEYQMAMSVDVDVLIVRANSVQKMAEMVRR